MKKIKKFLKKVFSIPVGIIAILLSIVLFYFCEYVLDEPQLIVNNEYISANDAAVSKSGLQAVVNGGKSISVIDLNDYSLVYSIDRFDLNAEKDKYTIYEVLFDDHDNLIVYYSLLNSEAYLKDSDNIAVFDTDGNLKEVIISIDYTREEIAPGRCKNLFGFNFSDGVLHFIYLYGNYGYCLVDYDFQTKMTFMSDDYSFGYATLYDAAYAYDKGYAVILTNGSIGYLNNDEYTEFYKPDISVYDENFDSSLIPSTIAYIDDTIYFYSGVYNDSLYYVDENTSELVYMCSVDDIADYYGFYDYYINSISYNDFVEGTDTLSLLVSDYVILDIGNPDSYADDGIVSFPLYKILLNLIIDNLPLIYFPLVLFGIIVLLGNLVKWRMSVLTKQLLITIPIVVVSFVVIFFMIFFEISENYYEITEDTMISVAQLSSNYFDGDEIASISTFDDFVDSGMMDYYHNLLAGIVEYNKGLWNKKYSVSVSKYMEVPGEEYGYFLNLVDSQALTQPFLPSYITALDGEFDLDNPDINMMFFDSSTASNISYICDYGLRDSNGKLVGVVEVATDSSDYDTMLTDLITKSVLLFFITIGITIFLISLLSYFNVRNLKKASYAVSEIAKGNFDSKIKNRGKDEISDICRGVNDMADQLNVLFAEKDENEKFYYKFVPQQFKSLLHKESITELSLGDAESVELTVLFCDIRNFSLNSEMMTAKENFDFINIIYGKAGPVIRNNNGFIDKYIGDAIMALFENADDAVNCGIELYKEIVLNSKTAEELDVSSINIGIGIHTGMARIGIVGEEERLSGTVISNTVNLSSRLESLTKKYNTAMIITKDTLDHLSNPDELNTRYLGMIQVAGVNEVKGLYEVLDCLDEQRFVERNDHKKEFREAIRLYHLGDLKGSLEIFKMLADNTKYDLSIHFYINYIEELIKSDDTDHKVFKFNTK